MCLSVYISICVCVPVCVCVCVLSLCEVVARLGEIVLFAEIGWHGDPHGVTYEGALG